jgi:outer membrane receptor protein involved in Fe transport
MTRMPIPRRILQAALLASALSVATPALAQLTTATIRGSVSNAATPAPGATVTAVNVETGATLHAVAGPDGSYVLSGLRPGTYDISVSSEGGAPVTQRVIVSVGQSATLDLDTSAPAAGAEGSEGTASAGGGGADIVITGTRLVETRTSETATNVTRDQIENLPQNNRNFLNFAALAPGIRVNQSEFRQTFSGGGVGADPNGDSFGGPQVNVFIDGVSLKSNVNQGGVVGQDVSRGNPFSQLAVQEFRVLTSNFKAEYEDAGTAIITAITKSGTNEFHGEAFGSYQDQNLISRDFFQKKNNQPKADLKRYQFGAALGGPIIKDRLFFFATYEGNVQDRVYSVNPGDPGAAAPQLGFDVNQYRGSFVSPFRENLGFAKLTWQMADNQVLELSGSIRKETDLRDFGGQASRERGTSVNNDVYTAKLNHTYTGDHILNEATIDYLKSDLAFGAAGSSGFGRIYQGIIQIGGRPDFQQVQQESVTFRDNLSFTDLHWNGDHLVKLGVKASFQNYRVGGTGPNANPQFEFVQDAAHNLDFTLPANVRFGGGDPEVEASTTQIGLFLQDDWEVNEHLLLNLGLRWDYDSNAKNNSFVTPAGAVQALNALATDPRLQNAFFDVQDYISTGKRKADLGNFAPRIGFSYDVNADQRTVFFGGYGRYYDRALFRSAAEETLLSQYRSGELLFSKDGTPRDGRTTILFKPEYLTEAGFAALLAGLAADPTSPGTSELRVIPNNLKTPYTDQFSVGIRQRLGIFRGSLTLNHTIGKNQIGYAPLNRSVVPGANGFYDYIPLINGYSNVVAAFNTRQTKYDAVYVTLDKPYTRSSGWGAGIAYTFVAQSKERGFAFNFDYPNIGAQPFVPNAGYEEHRAVINGMVDLPLEFRLSGLATIGSGAPFFVIDANQGFEPGKIRLGYFNHLPMFMQVDLRLQKIFHLGGDKELSLSAEVFNLFNRANFGGADGFTCCGGNPNFGVPNSLSGPPRSFQFGAAVRF